MDSEVCWVGDVEGVRGDETACVDAAIVLFTRHRRKVGGSGVVCLRTKSVSENAHKRKEKLMPSSRLGG